MLIHQSKGNFKSLNPNRRSGPNEYDSILYCSKNVTFFPSKMKVQNNQSLREKVSKYRKIHIH